MKCDISISHICITNVYTCNILAWIVAKEKNHHYVDHKRRQKETNSHLVSGENFSSSGQSPASDVGHVVGHLVPPTALLLPGCLLPPVCSHRDQLVVLLLPLQVPPVRLLVSMPSDWSSQTLPSSPACSTCATPGRTSSRRRRSLPGSGWFPICHSL